MKKYIFIVAAALVIGIAIIGYVIGNNTNTSGSTINNGSKSQTAKLTLEVSIPCSGHAGLIESEMQKLEGIENVSFRAPNLFDVYYNSDKISKENILSTGIFKEYPAKIVN